MNGIILQIVCYVAVLASFAPWSETSAAFSPLITPATPPPMYTFNPADTPCEGVRCPRGRRCAPDGNNQASCVCDENCFDDSYSLICGSDNKTYYNYCEVTRKACMTNSNLTVSYYGECRHEGSMCNGIACPLNRVCAVAGNRAICVCNEICPTNTGAVCGTDNQTYNSDCELRKHACLTNKKITIDYYTECKQATACDGFSCPNGTECAIDERKKPVCVCSEVCYDANGIICGTDGRTYGGECQLNRQACTSATSIRKAYNGHCLNGSVCSGFRCPKNNLCSVDEDNKPVCFCAQSCSSRYDPVCGSDGTTYRNLCYLEMQACFTGDNIIMVRKGQCRIDALCRRVECPYPKICGVNGKNQTFCVCNNNCGDYYSPLCGSDNKTYDNGCWFAYAYCQGNLRMTSYYGVCSEGPGCQGIYCPKGQHCDSQHQSQPKCVCDTFCPKTYSPICGTNNKTYNNMCELEKDACLTNTSIWTHFNRRCEYGPGCLYTDCPYGRVCVEDERNRPMCICSLRCAESTEVCGTDGKTYSSECFLGAAACMTNKTIARQRFELCKKVGPCNGFVCSSDKYCKVDQNGKSICVCNEDCSTFRGSLVCGSDNRTYSNLCELQKKACISSSSIRWLYDGACAEASVCDQISCPPHKRCALVDLNQATCVCIEECVVVEDPVCGSDGRTYRNECELQKSSCLSNRNVTTKYRGKCDKGLTCRDIRCPTDRVCALNEANQPTCVCTTVCNEAFFFDTVCGSDRKTYDSSCLLDRESCTKNKNIKMDYTGSCTNDAILTSTT